MTRPRLYLHSAWGRQKVYEQMTPGLGTVKQGNVPREVMTLGRR